MSGELGKASLDLEANLTQFEANVNRAGRTTEGLDRQLGALAAISDVATKALNDVGISPGRAAESRASAAAILEGVHGISDEARMAALELDHVKLTEKQAEESAVSGGLIDRVLNSISRNADQAKRKLLEVRLAGGRNGVGVGPFGSGFGRIGVLGAAVGVGALSAPAAAPAAVGLLAAIPTLALGGAAALGTLALAFSGVFKAIGGDKKAFNELTSSQKAFVQTVRSLSDWLDRLKQVAAQSLFPGLTKGLKAALSPGTVNAITTAVVELGRAFGQAGAQWGKYFGSREFQSIFGPLMQSAARNIGVLSDAFLHLFDALGVLGRAAIPFTNWLVDAADKGAKLVDSWIHAKDASGQLSHGMDEARVSLTLVAKLFGALLSAAFALGQALYPVAKVAVKALTDGLNALSGIIHRNEGDIRGIVGGALKVFVVAVKSAATGVGVLWHGLEGLIGHKAMIVGAIAAIGIALTVALGPASAAVVGALIAIGLIKDHWGTVKHFFINLGHEIVNAFRFLWAQLERGALKAALAVVEPFSHLPGFLGHWARVAKDRMQNQLDRIHPPNMDWGGYASEAGYATGVAWKKGFLSGIAGAITAAVDAVTGTISHLHVPKVKHDPKPGTHAWYMKYLGYDPTQQGSTFGKPPPFKSTGSGSGGGSSQIPLSVQQLDAQAARQDQAAAALNYHGQKARQHLNKEIEDLQKADKILEEKLKHAHGKRRLALYKALTANMKKIAEARKRLHQALAKSRQDELNFALDQAKLAVENAVQGSKAWEKAIAAEEKALRAEIRYWDKRAHNDKLSAAARDAALRKELSYEKQLKALQTATEQAANANIAQFLQSYVSIQDTFAPNAMPYQPPSSGKTDTHLHDIKQAARDTAAHLKAIRSKTRFPGSSAGLDAAMAVAG